MKPTIDALCEFIDSLPPESSFFELLKCNPKEEAVFRALGIVEHFDLIQQPQCGAGLFGYATSNGVTADFSYREMPALLIEAKFIRCREVGAAQNTEYDLKNGLAQIIEQATVSGKQEAILIVIDAGRARKRPLNTRERVYISMFKNNPFKVTLTIIRARVDEAGKRITCELI